MRTQFASMVLLMAAVLSPACTAQHADSESTISPRTSKAAEQAPSAPTPSHTGARTDGSWQTAGTTVQGRPIRTLTVGYGQRRVLFIGGIHGDESEGAFTTAQLPGAFTSANLTDRVTLTILEDANPDGRAAKTRSNAAGVDVNRNFPAPNFDPTDPANGRIPLSQPESRIVYNLIEETNPDLIVVMHSWHDKQFINFDGPAREIADRFSASSGLPVTESTEFAATPGSLGSYAGRDRQRAVLTIELRKGSNPAADWYQIRAALLAAIAG